MDRLGYVKQQLSMKGKAMKKYLGFLGLVAAVQLAGCAAVTNRTLEVETHMSESVFLDPVPPNLKVIYMSARNTSDHPELDIRSSLAAALTQRGYQVSDDPNKAHYMLRINILQAGKLDPADKDKVLGAKFGEALLGGVIAGGAASAFGASGRTATGVGVGVAAGVAIGNMLFKDVLYSVVVDIQLSERPLSGAKVKTSTNTASSQANMSAERSVSAKQKGGKTTVNVDASVQANSRNINQSIDEEKDFKQYQIRSVAYAEKVNLKFEEANPVLMAKLTSSLSNLFD